ncbi:MAG: hypothetical protein WCT19_00160 [Candidatus Paceibacterota bacterium]|jgi:hypothetical protein
MNAIKELTSLVIFPNHGNLAEELDRQLTHYNARLTLPIFEEPEPAQSQQAWLVRFRVTNLMVHEAMNAFREEVCQTEKSEKWVRTGLWEGFKTPFPENVAFGRLRHLLGQRNNPMLPTGHVCSVIGICDHGDKILAAGDDWKPAVPHQSLNLSPILRRDGEAKSINLFDTMLGKKTTPDIWWLFVEKVAKE